MNLNEELNQLNNKLDKFRRKQAAAEERGDQIVIKQFRREITKVTKKIANLKGQKTRLVSNKKVDVKSLAFHRVLTKAEQADMGKLKKSVKGLVVVHPLTALGRDMQITEVTGYAPKAF